MFRYDTFVHWNDLQCLEQAALVAKIQGTNLSSIREFCKREGKSQAFEDFKKQLSKSTI